MLVGKHAGSIQLDDRVFMAQDLVNLLAERAELSARLGQAGADWYAMRSQLVDLRRAIDDAMTELLQVPHAELTVVRPEGDCPPGCPRCTINKVQARIAELESKPKDA